MKKILLLLAFSLCACTHMTFKQGNATSPVTKTERMDFLVFGAIPLSRAPSSVCPDTVDEVDFYSNTTDVLLGIVTAGLYIRRHVDIHCHPTLSQAH